MQTKEFFVTFMACPRPLPMVHGPRSFEAEVLGVWSGAN